MKYIKQIAMLILMFVLGAAGYMTVKRYYANQEDVKVQLFNINSDNDHNRRSSFNRGYDEGYQDGQRDAQRNCQCDRSLI